MQASNKNRKTTARNKRSGLPQSVVREIVERKVNFADVTVTLGTALTATQVTDMAQGLDDGNRIGRTIFCDYVEWNYIFKRNLASAAVADCIRVLIIYKDDGTVPVWSDIFMNSTLHSVYRPQVSSPGKRLATTNTRVLYDEVYVVDSNGQAGAYCRGRMSIKLPSYYAGTASSDCNAGRVYLCMRSDNATANAPDARGVVGLYYTDQ